LSCEGGSVPPALPDRIALGRAVKLRDFSVYIYIVYIYNYSCCCTLLLLHSHLADWVSTLADTCLVSAYDTFYNVWLVRYMATLQNRQRAKSDSDVKIMYGFPHPRSPRPAIVHTCSNKTITANTICNQTFLLKMNTCVYSTLAFPLMAEYDPSDFNVLYLKIEVTYAGFLHK
jgi:hypothetical protein